MKFRFEKRLWRWLVCIGLACLVTVVNFLFVEVEYKLIYVGLALASGILAASLLVRVDLTSRWTLPLLWLFAAFAGVFLIHIVINGNPLSRMAFVYNMCFSLAFVFVFTAVTGNVKWAAVLWMTLAIFFGILDEVVYQFRGNKIVVNDVLSIGTALTVAGNYKIAYTPKFLIGIFTYLAAMLVLLRGKMYVWKVLKKWWMRLVCLALAALVCLFPISHLGRYKTYTFDKLGATIPGTLMEFALEISRMNIDAPEGYSAETVASLAEKYASPVTQEAEKEHPHVIAVMVEAWSDLSVLGDVRTDAPVMPFTDSFMQETIHGYALSSVYGGSTSTSEWEFLTGSTMAFLPTGATVYRQFVKDDIRSVVDVMQLNGYECVAMHPYYASGWDRSRIYPLLGFDETYFLEDMEWGATVRDYVSDEAFVDRLIEVFENREGDEPMFLFGITMQNHGGYTYEGFEPTVRVTSPGTNAVAEQYLSLLQLTDKAVERLVSYLQTCEEDVVLLMFGDHQPRMTADFMDALNDPSLVQQHTVPFFLWKNYEETAEALPLTSLNYLSTLMLSEAGIDLPAYYNFLAEAQKTVPALHAYGVYDGETTVEVSKAPADMQETLWEYSVFEYANVFDFAVGDEVFTGAK